MSKNYENWSGKKILVADDTPTNFMLIETALRNFGVKLIWAKNGMEAVEICRANSDIDLVLMDIRMPVMDGYEAARHIRDFRPDLPIIAQTSYAMQGDKEHSITSGCSGYLAKPISLDELKEIINKYLQK